MNLYILKLVKKWSGEDLWLWTLNTKVYIKLIMKSLIPHLLSSFPLKQDRRSTEPFTDYLCCILLNHQIFKKCRTAHFRFCPDHSEQLRLTGLCKELPDWINN